ncbi:MAG: diacylglycerol kinase family lipid kinase [Deltaproteobacteria bacterium]|nr:diacylglycerol kinase family lipid kinase [Deltaproteobacteria bacterium]
MSFHTCVIVNPASGGGATGRRWPEIRATLDRQLERWDSEFTLGPQDATRIAREAVAAGYEMIVGVGGDGTMGEIVTGLFETDSEGVTERLKRPDMVLGVVRYGTGGDFARFLGLPSRLDRAADHLSGRATRPADVGLVRHLNDRGEEVRSGFLNIASFGLSGVVDDKVNHTTKLLGGRVSFLVGLTRALVAFRPQAVRVSVNTQLFYEGPLVTGAIANGQYFGGGMKIARDAKIDDGLFDVVLQLRSGVKEVVSIRDVYTGSMADWASVMTTQGTVVEASPVDPEARVLLDIDGEQSGMLPARFTIIPQGVRLKV